MTETPLPSVRDVIRQHDLLARKSLGQHFLLDERLMDRIASGAGDVTGCTVIEIGPGPGGLTRALLRANAKQLIAVETDERCLAILAQLQEAYPDRLKVVHADALQTDLISLCDGPRKIVANLPYNIGTALLVKWLDDVYRFQEGKLPPDPPRCAPHGRAGDASQRGKAYESLTLMFQKEVADRISATPRSKEYGRLSVITQFLCKVEHCFDLPPGAFLPPPKVTSSVIRLIPYEKPLFDVRKETLEKLLLATFGQRRKMLRAALKSITPDSIALLESCGIEPTRRAEELSVGEFCRIAAAL